MGTRTERVYECDFIGCAETATIAEGGVRPGSWASLELRVDPRRPFRPMVLCPFHLQWLMEHLEDLELNEEF